MQYNIYDSISDNQYQKLDLELRRIDIPISRFVQHYSFYPERDSGKGGLGLGYEKKEDAFDGGIGISFDDLPGKPTFTLGMIKTYDTEKRRYYKREDVIKCFELSELEKSFEEWMVKAIERYNALTKQDLIEYVELS